MLDKRILEEIIHNSPLVLLGVKDEETIDAANNYLPYSTGFEIECEKKSNYNEDTFKNIPNIINDSHSDSFEQRYRIPNGVNGLICLFNICYHLGNNSLLNSGSGIHYHIDCTDVTLGELTTAFNVDTKFEEEILSELDTWKYGGNYNTRGTSFSIYNGGNWIRYNYIKTLEFRIGNMSFDYQVLVKQILHANSIVRKWKNKIPGLHNITYSPINYKEQIEYQKRMDITFTSYETRIKELSNRLKAVVKVEEETVDMETVKSCIKTRSHKLY